MIMRDMTAFDLNTINLTSQEMAYRIDNTMPASNFLRSLLRGCGGNSFKVCT